MRQAESRSAAGKIQINCSLAVISGFLFRLPLDGEGGVRATKSRANDG